MLFDLAASLKIWNVDALGEAMPGKLRAEWIAYRKLKDEYEKDALAAGKE